MNEQVDYQAKKAGPGTRFLWWCAGADAEILKYSSYSDHVKYAGIGGVVLATGFLAALSMGFAMHTIFRDDSGNGIWYVSIPIAIAWSLIVFNLDRFIVSSTGKGDGESSISGKEFLNALPRLLMATLLGITIAAPLETVIFDTEIQREWDSAKENMATARTYEIDQNYLRTEQDLEKAFIKKKEDILRQEETVEKNKLRVDIERKSGTGPQWQKSNQELDIEIKKLSDLRLDLEKLENEMNRLNFSKASEKKGEADRIQKLNPGFLDKIMMIERLSAEGKSVPKLDPATNKIIEGQEIEIYGSAFWAIWLVRLLFMIVEIAPVILKLMLIKGPYDYMSENVNQILETKQGISIYHMKDEHSQLHKLKRNHNPERIIAIIEHQNEKETENAKEAISAFAEKEKEQIRKDPDDFIKPTT
jgi:hypothetical protein